MKYKVTTAAFDVTTNPPTPVKFTYEGEGRINDYMGTETIDTETNVLFKTCKNVWDIEDTVLEFWNRLNESDKDGPHYTHTAGSKVVVVDVRPLLG